VILPVTILPYRRFQCVSIDMSSLFLRCGRKQAILAAVNAAAPKAFVRQMESTEP
jgi:hypothetical protein